MKKINSMYIMCIFIIFTFSSCKNAPKPNKNIIPMPAKDMEYKDDISGSTEIIPEVIIPKALEIQPTPSPTPKPYIPPGKPVKKPAATAKPLGYYSTPILNRNGDRIYNIMLGAKRINGYILKPNDTFSFNSVVGNRDTKNGFRSAAIIVHGKFDEGVGGGVCQLSTTIFNAADNAGLEILERHSHSRPVSYVPGGRDAAVNYGNLDFKFKNTKKYPVIIRIAVNNRMVYVSICKSK